MTEELKPLTSFEEQCANAVIAAVVTDNHKPWMDTPELNSQIVTIGILAIKRKEAIEQAERDAQPDSAERVDADSHIDGDGWSTDIRHAWRVVLNSSTAPAVVYFTSEPEYATLKAFARAANLRPDQVVAEARPE